MELLAGFDGHTLATGVLEVQQHRRFTRMLTQGVVDFHEVDLTVFGRPQDQLDWTLAVFAVLLGLELGDFITGEAAAAIAQDGAGASDLDGII